MLIGVDTGFFFAIEEEHPLALRIWDEKEIITSSIVLYELQKHLLKGHFKNWESIIKDVERSTIAIPLTTDIALDAGHIAYETGIPGLDSLILSCLLKADCKEIYTTDSHFELYHKKGVKIINIGR